MNHPVYSISTDFRYQYPNGYAVSCCTELDHVHPSGSMWLAPSFLVSKSFIRGLWVLLAHTWRHYTQTSTQATWIPTTFTATQRSTRLRPRSHVIGRRVVYLIMLIKRFCNAKYVWLCKTVLELCLQFKLPALDVAVLLMVWRRRCVQTFKILQGVWHESGERHAYVELEGKPGGNRRRWENNIKMALKAMRWWR
jgi:hypothetical protein